MKLVVSHNVPTVKPDASLQDRLMTLAARVVPDHEWNYMPVPLAQKKADRALFERCKAEMDR